jgi:hypothetical protein
MATSATLAIREARLKLKPEAAAAALLDGYGKTLAARGLPFLLAGRHDRLARLVDDELPDAGRW